LSLQETARTEIGPFITNTLLPEEIVYKIFYSSIFCMTALYLPTFPLVKLSFSRHSEKINSQMEIGKKNQTNSLKISFQKHFQ